MTVRVARQGSAQREQHRDAGPAGGQPVGCVGLPLQRSESLEVVEVVLVEELDTQSGLGDRGNYLADSVLELHAPRMLQWRRPIGVAPGTLDHLGPVVEVVVGDHGTTGLVEYLREGVPID